jgi:hypothetical protein
MKKDLSVAIMVYGNADPGRDALAEEKYKDLAAAFVAEGCKVQSILYNDQQADELAKSLRTFDAILVWVNPIEQGNNRKKLDALLADISSKGCFVSTHPEVILKMGTKEVLFRTKNMDWGGDTKMYNSVDDFKLRFPVSLKTSGTRVLKQYRGNGGNGVYKIMEGPSTNEVTIVHAMAGNEKKIMTMDEFFSVFKTFFDDDGMLIDQDWNTTISNGMIRCYVSGNKVAGFGYQEINALYELNGVHVPPGKRYYYTENCGLFRDLKEVMENKWVPELQKLLSISNEMMPVIWDADFFINTITGPAIGKYTLCEINVSCVSPFPPGAVRWIVTQVVNRVGEDAGS